MIAGIKKRFNSRRKVDSEFAATTSVGSLFQMCGAATAKAHNMHNMDNTDDSAVN